MNGSNWLTLNDLLQEIKEFAQSRNLNIQFTNGKISLCSASQCNFRNDCHIATFEAQVTFPNNFPQRTLFVISVDNCCQNGNYYDRIGGNGELVGVVLSRDKSLKHIVLSEINSYLELAYKIFKLKCPNC